jgi:hypothetical protein
VNVVERRALASVHAPDGSWRIVDASGRIVAATAGQPAGLPVVGVTGTIGAPGTDLAAAARPALDAARELPDGLRTTVTGIAADAHGDVTLTLASGGHVLLGGSDRLADKFVALLALAPQVTAGATLDVRAPTKPALTGAST